MRAKDIKMDTVYKLKNNPYPIKTVKLLKPKEAENDRNCILIKCLHSSGCGFDFALVRYFKPVDIERL